MDLSVFRARSFFVSKAFFPPSLLVLSIRMHWQIELNVFLEEKMEKHDWIEDMKNGGKKKKIVFRNVRLNVSFREFHLCSPTCEIIYLFIRKHKRHVTKFSITGPIPGIFFISHDR